MRFVIPLAAMVFTAQAGWANPALGLPFTKQAPVSYRIETREAHPAYTFFLVREVHRDGEATRKIEHVLDAEYFELTPDQPLVLRPGSAGESATLVIVPRPDVGEYHSPAELLKSRPDLARHAVYQSFEFREEVPSWAGGDITVTYCVRPARSGGKLEVVRASWHPLWQWFAAAIGFAAAVLLVGFWLVRRKYRSSAVTTRPQQAA